MDEKLAIKIGCVSEKGEVPILKKPIRYQPCSDNRCHSSMQIRIVALWGLLVSSGEEAPQ